jgi:hypothetical protein
MMDLLKHVGSYMEKRSIEKDQTSLQQKVS